MKAQYTCNCINYNTLFDNATEMAQAVENAKKISKREFEYLAEVLLLHSKIKEAEYSQNKNLLILYDIKKDKHYFYL